METSHYLLQSSYFAPKNSHVEHPGLLGDADNCKPLPLVNKVFRILRHLNKDIRRNHPLVSQPSSYLLKKFVENYLNSEVGQQQRPQKHHELKFITEECLQFLRMKCLLGEEQSLINKDTTKPLFPNQESFTKHDALNYFQSAIHTYKLATASMGSS